MILEPDQHSSVYGTLVRWENSLIPIYEQLELTGNIVYISWLLAEWKLLFENIIY